MSPLDFDLLDLDLEDTLEQQDELQAEFDRWAAEDELLLQHYSQHPEDLELDDTARAHLEADLLDDFVPPL